MSVRVADLTKRFTARGTPAVAEVTFEAPSGAISALIGPSGAGKSTVLRLVAGLEVPDQGRILIEGADVTSQPVQRRGVGLVFQSYALFQHMNVRDNVAFGLNVRRRPRREVNDRVDELLRLVQLEELARRYPSQLSGGQRQRVAFARALAIRPKVLLLDEPFGALDARVRVELRDWLHRLHDETHVTTILVTHDQEEALEVSQYVVVMIDGRVVQAGTPLDVYDHPATSAVASFLGGSILRGCVRGGRAEVGPLSRAVPAHIPDGAAVHAVVRSHDIRIERQRRGIRIERTRDADTTASSVVPGKIMRQVSVGAHVKLELTLTTGDVVTVHVPRREFEGLDLTAGEAVLVDLERARVFVEDYVI